MNCRAYKCRDRAQHYMFPYIPFSVKIEVCNFKVHQYCSKHFDYIQQRFT